MQVRARICDRDDPKQTTWFENYDFPDLTTSSTEAQAEAVDRVKGFITYYNSTLRTHDRARKLKGLKIMGKSEAHNWRKVNSFTVVTRGGQSYDVGECTNCGAMGKRYGLGSTFLADRVKEQKCPKGK